LKKFHFKKNSIQKILRLTNFWSFSKFKQTFRCSILVHLFISLSSVDKPQIIFILFYLLLYLFIYWIIQYLTVCETPDFYFLATVLGLLKKFFKISGSHFPVPSLKKISLFSVPKKKPKIFSSLHSSLVYQTETFPLHFC